MFTTTFFIWSQSSMESIGVINVVPSHYILQ